MIRISQSVLCLAAVGSLFLANSVVAQEHPASPVHHFFVYGGLALPVGNVSAAPIVLQTNLYGA